MRKTKQTLSNAIDQYIGRIRAEFPGLTIETQLNPEDGVDAWLRLQLNSTDNKRRSEIEAFTASLTLQTLNECDFYLVAIPHIKEPVHG